QRDQHGHKHDTGQIAPAFARNKGMGIGRFIHRKSKNNRKYKRPAMAGRLHDQLINQFLLWSTSLLAAIQGIMARNFEPTCSICDSALMRRREVSVGAPAAFSRMKFLA